MQPQTLHKESPFGRQSLRVGGWRETSRFPESLFLLPKRPSQRGSQLVRVFLQAFPRPLVDKLEDRL